MSCRVLKRGLEHFTLSEIVRRASLRGAKAILGEYLPTSKNALVQNFYPSLGFEPEGKYFKRSLLISNEFKTAIQLDAAYAKRTPYAERVVYGMAAVLAALGK